MHSDVVRSFATVLLQLAQLVFFFGKSKLLEVDPVTTLPLLLGPPNKFLLQRHPITRGLSCDYAVVTLKNRGNDRRNTTEGYKNRKHTKAMKSTLGIALATTCVVGSLLQDASAFVPTSHRIGQRLQVEDITRVKASNLLGDADSRSFVLPREEVNPLISFDVAEGKEKVVNAFGVWCLVVSLLTGPIWMLAMKVVHRMENDENRALFDMTGKIWAKSWLTMTNSYPVITGNREYLDAENNAGACLFVANHASWLDIPVLCTVLDPVFKFIAKGELMNVPCIGTQLIGGEHILIEREDRRSQFATFKKGIQYLKKGIPIMAFPEGKRSQDGHLMEFKGGVFAMAAKTNVPIVPITLAHTHAIMPSNALLPVQSGAGKLRVHVHDAIDTAGKSEAELEALVRASFLRSLPLDQHPLEPVPSKEEFAAMSETRAAQESKSESKEEVLQSA